MKTVDVIRPGSLNTIIGPSGTLKRILKHREYFIGRGYDIKIFTHDDINCTASMRSSTSHNKSWKFRLKSFLRLQARNIPLLACIYIYKDYLFTKKLVKYYLSLNRKSDYIVFHSHLECYLYAKLAGDNHAKVVMFLHSDGNPLSMELQYYKSIKGKYMHKIMQMMHDTAVYKSNKIVFITHVGENNFCDYYRDLPAGKTCVILNGIDDLSSEQKSYNLSNLSKQGSFRYRLICCGTINYRKGHKIIIDALTMISKERLSDIHVTFVGDGAERISLQEYIDKNGLSNHVSFIGAVPNTEVYKYLYESNIYILMSRNEGLPISIIEAMRAGLAVISTPIAGIPELVDDRNGLLIEPEPMELAKIMENLDAYDWEGMGRRSRNIFINNFTFDRMREEYCNMLDSIL